MLRRTWLWPGILAALVLKWTGATWDVAWHFRQVNDAESPAHLINLAGNFLLVGMLLLAWRTRTAEERGPWRMTLVGLLMAGLAVPLDQWWHHVFGLDLTSWSPTHMLLFSGTAVMSAGIAWLAMAQAGWRPGMRVRDVGLRPAQWLLVGFLLFRVVSVVLFPPVFNEYAAVAAENVHSGYAIYDVQPDIKEFAEGVDDLPYDDLPHALYPMVTLGLLAAFTITYRRLTGVPFFGTAVAAFYVATRLLSDSVLGALGWPVAALPWQHILIAAAFDAAWWLPVAPPSRAVVGAIGATVLAYGYWAVAGAWTYTTPLDWGTLPWGLGAALGVAVLAAVLRPFTWPGRWTGWRTAQAG